LFSSGKTPLYKDNERQPVFVLIFVAKPRSQSYKMSFEQKHHFFGVNYANFLRTNLSVEIIAKIKAKINAKKHLLS
jgi:hypothetical protein